MAWCSFPLSPSRFLVTDLQKDQAKARPLVLFLGDLRDQNVLVLLPDSEKGSGFYSPVFVVGKPNGKFCPILNLRDLNSFNRYKRFGMDYLVKSLLYRDYFMISLDMRDAYLHIPMRASTQRYQRVSVRLMGRLIFSFQHSRLASFLRPGFLPGARGGLSFTALGKSLYNSVPGTTCSWWSLQQNESRWIR